MQPSEYVGHLGELPDATAEPHVAVLVKRYAYISLVLRPQMERRDENIAVLTVHQAEARKLAEALLEVAELPVREDFVDQAWQASEGVFLGGPPRREELVEANPDLLRREPSDRA